MRTDLIQCALGEQELEKLKRAKDNPAGLIAMLQGLGVRYIIQDTLTHAGAVPGWDRLRDLPSAPVLSRQAFGPNDRMVVYTLSAEEESDPPHVQCTEVEESIWRVGGSDGGSPKVRSQ